MIHLLDEAGCQKLLDLLPNHLAPFIVEAAQSLLYWPGALLNVQGVLGDVPRYARHVRGPPREDIDIRAEVVDELAFLFGGEGSADVHHLLLPVDHVENDGLGPFD